MLELVKVYDVEEMDIALDAMNLVGGYIDMEVWDDLVELLAADGVIYVFENLQEAFEYIVEHAEDWMWL